MSKQPKQNSNFSSLNNNQNVTQKSYITSTDSTTYEFVTKKRNNLYNNSLLKLQSPKKQNPNKRIEIVKKEIKLENNNSNYQLLIKRIAKQLKHRVRLPTNKIIKVYEPYRTLIMRIAHGIKKTAKNLNYWNKLGSDKFKEDQINKEKNIFGITLMKKEQKNSKSLIEDKENIKLLSEISDSDLNVDFVNEFEKYLGKNNIEIVKESKLPSFKNEKNEYLLANIQFWKKYINFICLKYREEMTLFNFINLLEQFYLWVKDPDDAIFFNKLILQKIQFIFEQNIINDFLLTHKLKNLDDLFARYKIIDNKKAKFKEMKVEDNCECPSCQVMKEKSINSETIKFPESGIKYKSKNSKITDYYGLSIKIKPSQNKTQKKMVKYNDDKKIPDYFSFTKEKQEKKEKEKQKSKSRSKSKKNKNRNSNNNKRSLAEKKKKEILELLNLEPEN